MVLLMSKLLLSGFKQIQETSVENQGYNVYDEKCRAKLNTSQIKGLSARHLFDHFVMQRAKVNNNACRY